MDDLSAESRRFVRRSVIKTTLQQIKRFHQHPQALAKLTSPPIIMQLHRDDRRSLTECELEFTLWFGPLPKRWIARHEPGPTPDSFADTQVLGPMAFWRRENIYVEVTEGVELTDHIVMAHRPGRIGTLTRLFFDGIPLRLLFAYRHLRTRLATQS